MDYLLARRWIMLEGKLNDCKNEILRKLPQLSYVDTVETTNEGLTYIKR